MTPERLADLERRAQYVKRHADGQWNATGAEHHAKVMADAVLELVAEMREVNDGLEARAA